MKLVNKNREKTFSALLRSVWLFPLIIFTAFMILVSSNINGSSVGVYHDILYGKNSKDKNLLYGTPKTIRSDEWLSWTQEAVLQSKTGYPSFNTKLGHDGDLTKNVEIPVNDWVGIFRPNNWSFFFLPLEFAYAFKWWFLLVILIISGYFFILRMLSGQRLVAALLSLSFAISPFVFWWYQSALFLSLAYGFLALILAIRVIDKEPIPKIKSPLLTKTIYTAGLTYIGASLGLLLYPPYALPVFLGVVAFLIGYIINKKVADNLAYKVLLKRFLPFVIAAALVIVIGVLFVLQHQELIRATANSIYPGQRRIHSGDLPLLAVLDGFLMPLLQGATKGMNYYTNQSEASNFILFLPFLIIPGFVLQIIEYVKYKKIDWTFLAIQLCGILFLVRALVPVDSFIYHVLLLDRVPNIRLRSGMGFVGLLQLVLIIKKYPQLKLSLPTRRVLAGLFGIISFVVLIITGIYIKQHYPLFLNSYTLLIGLAFSFTAIVIAFLSGKQKLGVILLLIFSLASSFKILPLYHGLGFIENGKVVKSISSVSKPDGRWITTDDLRFTNLPLAAGRVNISGSQNYPDPKLWSQIGGTKYENVYNRQARVVYTTAPMEEKLHLVQPNYYVVKFECSKFLFDHVDFILASKVIDSNCSNLIKTIHYPKDEFYIYKVVQPN